MSRKIKLTQGQFAIVDDSDYEKLIRFKWCAHKVRRKQTVYGFRAMRTCRCPFSVKQHGIYMHRVIMQCPQGFEVDHRDRDQLNNQKYNLRICTHSQNLQNRPIRIDSHNKYKGIVWHSSTNKWQARIKVNGHKISLGYYDDELDAAMAYDEGALMYHEEFAHTNF